MELYLDYNNKRHLKDLLNDIHNFEPKIKEIYAAIAYNRDPLLINKTLENPDNKITLHWWGLFDLTQATGIDLIKLALKNDNIHFYPIDMNFHSKIIYFIDYGVYIGSANMTDKALTRNQEVGVFLEKKDLTEEQLKDIDTYFSELENKSCEINKDNFDINKFENIVKKYSELESKNNTEKSNLLKEFENNFKHLFEISSQPQQGEGISQTSGNEQEEINDKNDKQSDVDNKKRTPRVLKPHIKTVGIEIPKTSEEILEHIFEPENIKWFKRTKSGNSTPDYMDSDYYNRFKRRRIDGKEDGTACFALQVPKYSKGQKKLLGYYKNLNKVQPEQLILLAQTLEDPEILCITHLLTPISKNILVDDNPYNSKEEEKEKIWCGRWMEVIAMTNENTETNKITGENGRIITVGSVGWYDFRWKKIEQNSDDYDPEDVENSQYGDPIKLQGPSVRWLEDKIDPIDFKTLRENIFEAFKPFWNKNFKRIDD